MGEQILSVGKQDPKTLSKLVFGCLGALDPRTILNPKIGEDGELVLARRARLWRFQ